MHILNDHLSCGPHEVRDRIRPNHSALRAETPRIFDSSRSQDALDQVRPGDSILLEDGEYWEDAKTMVRAERDLESTARVQQK